MRRRSPSRLRQDRTGLRLLSLSEQRPRVCKVSPRLGEESALLPAGTPAPATPPHMPLENPSRKRLSRLCGVADGSSALVAVA